MTKRIRTSTGGQGGGGTTIVYVEVPVGAAGDITTEKLSYDLPEFNPLAQDENSAAIIAGQEVNPGPVEDAAAGVLFTVLEDQPPVVELEQVKATVDATESNTDAVDAGTLEARAVESSPEAFDQTTAAILNLTEANPDPIELAISGVTVTAGETVVEAADLASAVTAAQEILDNSTLFDTVELSLTFFRPSSVESFSGFVLPNAVYDNDTTTASRASVSSSGIGGITSNTNSINAVFRYSNLNFGDLEVFGTNFGPNITNVFTDQWSTTSGALFGGSSYALNFQYSFNPGGPITYQTIQTKSAGGPVSKSNNQNSIPYANMPVTGDTLSDLYFRVIGTITSGTGIAGSHTMSYDLFDWRMTLTARRLYTS